VTGPVETALAELEGRRRGRILVVGLLVAAALATVALALVDAAAFESLPLALALLAVVTLAYGGWVLVEERRAKRMLRSLIAERERASGLSARVEAMETLHLVTRDLSASGELADVFERLLTGAARLVGATAGLVALRAGAEGPLTVAASTGAAAPPRGTVLPEDGSLPHAAVQRGVAVVAGRGTPSGDPTGPARIAAPLRLQDRTLGVLLLEQAGPTAPSDPVRAQPHAAVVADAEVAVVELFAQHAALAVRNAWRLDEQRNLADELERAAARRAEVLAGIVHDLRAPLTAASGFVSVLGDQERALTPERRGALLDDVQGELARLATIVEELLAVAAAEAGELRRSEILDVAELVRDVAQVGRGLIAARRTPGADGGLRVDAPGPAPVRGDAVALERVVTNLLENAVKHTPPGTPIDVTVRRDDEVVHIGVRDHGPTPAAEVLADAFDAFATRSGSPAAGDEPRPATRGRGLGLHVVRTLVEAHGGSVTLRAVPADAGSGTIAEVVLPVAVPTDGGAQLGR
jgi:signal transduction histidine kinase